MLSMLWIYFFLIALQTWKFGFSHKTITVQTKLGDIEGIVVDKKGKIVNQFLNIPYAMPPVGDLRFEKPIPVQSWFGVYNATAYGPSCMQIRPKSEYDFIPTKALSEDCLSLNIYVANEIERSANKSVMIWVHGGGYSVAQAALYDGSYLAITGNVIIITINYRLGVFGFASAGDPIFPGNYGLWDQLMAIKWVKENIKDFGGNSDSITIFGESAGAESVSMLSITPHSDQLFQRVITESGSCLNPSFTRHAGKWHVKNIAKELNCNLTSSDTQELLKCLRGATASELLNITNFKMSTWDFGPVTDGDLIPDLPKLMLGNVSSKAYSLFFSRDVLMGTNSAEGGLDFSYIKQINNINISVGVSTDTLCTKISPSLSSRYFDSNNKISAAICDMYKVNDDTGAQARAVINLYGDFEYVVPTVKLLTVHKMSNKGTYQYLFSQQTRLMNGPPHPSWFIGANHADELGFVFGMMNLNSIRYKGDEDLADLVMTYWTNFAKFGNPNGNQMVGNKTLLHWPSYTADQSFMNLSRTSTTQTNLFKRRMDFWLRTIPVLEMKDPIYSVFG